MVMWSVSSIDLGDAEQQCITGKSMLWMDLNLVVMFEPPHLPM
jgi:hypothetical protein